MFSSPVTPAPIALPPHEHQPLLLQEAAGWRTWAFYYATAHTGFSGRVENEITCLFQAGSRYHTIDFF
jgi:hypothetical protein